MEPCGISPLLRLWAREKINGLKTPIKELNREVAKTIVPGIGTTSEFC
jgi:hypothetical protein